MRDMEVLAGGPLPIPHLSADIFTKGGGIPFFMEDCPLLDNTLARFLLSAVDLFKGKQWRMFDALRHLKAGFLPLSQAETVGLCAYIREYGIQGSMLKKPLAKAPEEIEELRSRAFRPAGDRKSNGGRAARSPRLLLQYMENLGVRETLEKQAGKPRRRVCPRGPAISRGFMKKTCELLEQTALFTRSMVMADFGDILESGLAGSEIAVVPPRVDEVVVGDIAHGIFPPQKWYSCWGPATAPCRRRGSSGGLINDYEMEEAQGKLAEFFRTSFPLTTRNPISAGRSIAGKSWSCALIRPMACLRIWCIGCFAFPGTEAAFRREASPHGGLGNGEPGRGAAPPGREKMEGPDPAYIKNRGMLLELLPKVVKPPAQLGEAWRKRGCMAPQGQRILH